ncbi:MAG: ATP-binding protein [Clostridia bacterium]
MKFINYLKDKMYIICIIFFLLVLMFVTLNIFKVNIIINIYILIIFCISFLAIFIYEYIKRKKFYNGILKTITDLDKKYLVHELLESSCFLEGEMLRNILYDTHKSYIDNLNRYKTNIEDFKDYIQMWLHEIKTPISAAKLIIENNKNIVTKSLNEEVEKIDDLTEQVMFYIRSEVLEKDYIIKDVNLKEIIDRIIIKNKKILMSKKFKINIDIKDCTIKSDIKWLEYILDQIIINAIKYSKDKPVLDITLISNKDEVTLSIKDNGIGISSSDISRIFDKGFTGENGRKKYSSTGLGLYICKNLCRKLNHNLVVLSKENYYTIVNVIFPNSSHNKVAKD